NDYLLETMGDAFETNSIQAIYGSYSALIEPYATTELSGYSFLNSESDFYQAIEELNEHAEDRAAAVELYLINQ
ncbi:MAG: spore coat protein, partial [Thalassotalea sp.]|nr:spore coat protein [Thalassotalea sp.]